MFFYIQKITKAHLRTPLTNDEIINIETRMALLTASPNQGALLPSTKSSFTNDDHDGV